MDEVYEEAIQRILNARRSQKRPLRRFKFGESVVTIGARRKLTVIKWNQDSDSCRCIPRKNFRNRLDYNDEVWDWYDSPILIAESIH